MSSGAKVISAFIRETVAGTIRNWCSYHNASQKIIMIIFVHICMYTFENKRMRMQPRNFGETKNRFCEKWL